MRPTILLDKSFLDGVSANRLRGLGTSHELLMPDVLFFEMISTGEQSRTRCFSKLPTGENPITLVTHVGALLQKELQSHQPAGKPSENRESFRFKFHPQLADGSYTFDNQTQAALDESNEELKREVESLADYISMLPTLFPNLLKGSDHDRKNARMEAEEFLAKDSEQIIAFLSKLQHPSFPPLMGATITPSWTLFRWFQVKMLFSIDLYIRYSGNIPRVKSEKLYKKLEHDVLDMQYLILGALEGSFATLEKKLIRMYQLICPEGAIYM